MPTRRLSLILLLVSAVTCLNAQSSSDDKDKEPSNLAKRLGDEVEHFVNRVSDIMNDANAPDDTLAARKKGRLPEDLENDVDTYTFTGDKTIEASQTIDGNIVVKGGDLKVYGTINGDVLVVGGTLYVKNGGRITGNARAINGTIVKEDDGTIEGTQDKSRPASYRPDRRPWEGSGPTFSAPWIPEGENLDNFLFRYNRVEGLFLGLGSEKKYYWDGGKNFSAYGSLGYGFGSHLWRYDLGVTRQFAISGQNSHRLLELGVEGYSLTDSKDDWLINVLENSAAAFFIHEDFRDYFTRHGATAHIGYLTEQGDLKSETQISYAADRYESMENRVDWSLFGGDKVFRLNPAIDPGNMQSVKAMFGATTLTKSARGPEGWSLYASSEFAQTGFGSDFDFNQYILDIRRYQPISHVDNINIRLRVGTADGNVPLQKMFDLGGLGTLNAFPFKSETGNRMILGNAEYILNGSFLDDLDFWPDWLFDHFNFLFLADAGLVRNEAPHVIAGDGFENLTWQEFRTDLGFGFANRSGSFRIAVTWRTDVVAPARVILRLTRPF